MRAGTGARHVRDVEADAQRQHDVMSLQRRLDEVQNALGGVQRELEQSTHLVRLGLLAASIAHEFNNLLTPVLGYCRAALRRPGDAPLQRKALEQAALGAERATEIATTILELARGAAGGAAGSEVRPGVGAGVAGAGSGGGAARERPSALVEASARSVMDSIAPTPGGPFMRLHCPATLAVAMTPAALHHVLLNLILNARQAIARGGGTAVEVRATWGEGSGGERSTGNTDDATRWVRICVADDGPGIADSVRGRLFEPLVRGADEAVEGGGAKPERHRGTGLGLALCRELVEAAGGSIRAATRAPRGTVVEVLLPHADSLPDLGQVVPREGGGRAAARGVPRVA